MEHLIEDVYHIIKDYRQEDGLMSKLIIKRWIDQFDFHDREFLLNEMITLLKKRYFSKTFVELNLEQVINIISKHYGYNKPAEFLKASIFIKHQPEGKSQNDILKLLNNISKKSFGFDILSNINKNPRFFIYLDDVFCTGDTLFKGLTGMNDEDVEGGWLFQKIGDKTHLEYLISSNAQLLIIHFINHRFQSQNFNQRLSWGRLREDIIEYYKFIAVVWVENDYRRKDSKLDFIFPLKENLSNDILALCGNLSLNNESTFRNENMPEKENFFSSAKNRIRFENIILKKSLELYKLSGKNRHPRMRPLGYSLQSQKTLGFGAFCFTYRNVPFNTPLVFWHEGSGWEPLFKRKHTIY